MNASLETFARRNGHLDEEAAYEELLAKDSVRQWIADDTARARRLRQEFHLAWTSVHASEEAPHAMATDAGATHADRAPTVPDATDDRAYLCTHCHAPEVRAHRGTHGGILVLCDHCDRRYDNLLELVPVESVGPLTFVFGTGWQGAIVPTAGTAALTAIYLALRWLR